MELFDMTKDKPAKTKRQCGKTPQAPPLAPSPADIARLADGAETQRLVVAAGGYRGHAIRGYACSNICSGQKHTLARLRAYLDTYRPRYPGDWNSDAWRDPAIDPATQTADWLHERERDAEIPGFRN
jgi:hypothetical protein